MATLPQAWLAFRCIATVTSAAVLVFASLPRDAGAQSASTIDLAGFIASETGATFNYTGTYTNSGLGVQATVVATILSDATSGDVRERREQVVFTINGSSLTETSDTAIDATSVRTLREEARTTVPRGLYVYDAWPLPVPRVFSRGQLYSVQDHYIYNTAGGAVTRSGTARVSLEDVSTALGTFNCLRLSLSVTETEDASGQRLTRAVDTWFARGFGVVKFKLLVLGPQSGMSVTRDFTITGSSRPIVNLPADPDDVLPPVFTAQPVGGWIVPEQSILLVPAATGASPLRYQWYRDGQILPFAVAATYAASSAGTYHVIVSNDSGSATSGPAVVTLADAPVILAPPVSQRIVPGATALLRVAAIGRTPLMYQWRRDDVDLPDENRPWIETSTLGGYSVVVSNLTASVTVTPAVLQAAPDAATARLVNLSARAVARGGASLIIPGFVVAPGGPPCRVLVRAVGPGLGGLGVGDWLPGTMLNLTHQSGGPSLGANAGWDASDAELLAVTSAVGAFPLAPGSHDCALVRTLAPDLYTAHVTGAGGMTGVALVELYDADEDPGAHLINLSARAYVGQNDNVLIGGLVIDGHAALRVLVRAVGPSLQALGLTGTLPDPEFTIYDRINRAVGANADWDNNDPQLAAATAKTQAFMLTAPNDAAAVLTLDPGSYTIVVRGRGGVTGIALVEIYAVP